MVPSEEALLCELSKLYRPTVAINEDEDQGGRTVVLPLSGCGTENGELNRSAWNSRRHETGMVPVVSSDAC